MKVAASPDGYVDGMTASPLSLVSSFRLPAGISLKSVRLVTFHAARSFGDISLALSDTRDFSSPPITANTLPLTGRRLSVRVGACLQWHGYTGKTLYVQEPVNGTPVTAITLSGVANVS